MTDPKLKGCDVGLINRLRQMSGAFRSSYASLTDKSGIWLSVGGLDNNEGPHSDIDSIALNGAMKPFYERLLKEWERSADKENLTRDDFLRIQRAIGTMPGGAPGFQSTGPELPQTLIWGLIEIMGALFF